MTPQRLTDAELKEALEVAGKATPGKWEACPEKEYIFCNGDMIAEVRGIGAFLNTERNCEHIATMNPEFSSRLIKELQWYRSGEIHTCHDKCEREFCKLLREVIWARDLLKQAEHVISMIETVDEPIEDWLELYERGPG